MLRLLEVQHDLNSARTLAQQHRRGCQPVSTAGTKVAEFCSDCDGTQAGKNRASSAEAPSQPGRLRRHWKSPLSTEVDLKPRLKMWDESMMSYDVEDCVLLDSDRH